MVWTNRGSVRGPAGSDADVTAHEAASDPHSQYLTQTEGDARYPLGTDTRMSVKPYPPVTLTDAATIATNAALGTHFRCALTASRTIGAPTNPTDGQVAVWELTASGGSWTPTLATGTGGFAFGTDITAVTAIGSGLTDYIQAVYRTSVNRWRVTGYVKGY